MEATVPTKGIDDEEVVLCFNMLPDSKALQLPKCDSNRLKRSSDPILKR